MWQILWMLSFVPDWIFQALIVSCVIAILASYVLKRIPFVRVYNAPIRIIAVVILIATVWIEGGRDVEAAWKAKVEELEAKVKESEEKSKVVNTEIQIKYRDRVKTVVEVQEVIKEKIKEVAVMIDKDCKVDPQAITILNNSAKNEVIKK